VTYNPIRAAAAAAAYSQHHHPAAHHFNQGGPQPGGGPPTHHHSAVDPAGFGSPRTALGAYPFPPMHQNTYTGYHLGSYAPQCPSPPKDGKNEATSKFPSGHRPQCLMFSARF
jgi:homeobox protein DLX2